MKRINIVKIKSADNTIGIKADNLFSCTIGNIRDRLKYVCEESGLSIYKNGDGGVKAAFSFKPLKDTEL